MSLIKVKRDLDFEGRLELSARSKLELRMFLGGKDNLEVPVDLIPQNTYVGDLDYIVIPNSDLLLHDDMLRIYSGGLHLAENGQSLNCFDGMKCQIGTLYKKEGIIKAKLGPWFKYADFEIFLN